MGDYGSVLGLGAQVLGVAGIPGVSSGPQRREMNRALEFC